MGVWLVVGIADMLEKDGKSFREVMLAWFKYLRKQSTCHTEDSQEENYYTLVLVAYNGFSTDFRHLLKQCEIYDIDLHRKLQESNVSLRRHSETRSRLSVLEKLRMGPQC